MKIHAVAWVGRRIAGWLSIPSFELSAFFTVMCVCVCVMPFVELFFVGVDCCVQVDTSRNVIVEFDSNSHGPWIFKPENSSLMLHPGELITVNFKITNPSNYPISGQAIPSYAPLQASNYLKKIECFCFEQQRLEGKETRNFPVVFLLDPELPMEISNITMSYTFFEITNAANF